MPTARTSTRSWRYSSRRGRRARRCARRSAGPRSWRSSPQRERGHEQGVVSICLAGWGVLDSTPCGVTTLGGVPSSRPANPTVLLILVAVVWVVASRVVPGHWILTLLVAAVAVNALLWL